MAGRPASGSAHLAVATKPVEDKMRIAVGPVWLRNEDVVRAWRSPHHPPPAGELPCRENFRERWVDRYLSRAAGLHGLLEPRPRAERRSDEELAERLEHAYRR